MAEGNWSVIRVEKISAEGAQKTERHNERKNESYANLNVDTEQIARNVHFKDTGGLTYNEYFQRLIDEGKISTRGQKAGATIFNELVIDVNTRYFEEHGGYEYAKQFYEEAYRFGCAIYGEDNIVSAVMHADEINKAVSEEVGKPVYHYHLHIVAIPTVRKEILWSKRCKDEALRGTVKEVINQVSHSKKWKNTVPLSMYLTLIENDFTQEEALMIAHKEIQHHARNMAEENAKLKKMPFTYGLFKMFAKSHMKKKYPIEGFTVEWKRNDSMVYYRLWV